MNQKKLFQKALATAVRNAKKEGENLTEQQVNEETLKLMVQLTEKAKLVKVSPEYSAPAICSEFISIAQNMGFSRLEIRIKAPFESVDKKGRRKIRKSYVQYVQGSDYSLKVGA